MPPRRLSTSSRGRGRGRTTAVRSFPVDPPPEESASGNNNSKTQASIAPELEEQTTVPLTVSVESKAGELSGKTGVSVGNLGECGGGGGDEVGKDGVVSRVVEELDGGMTEDGRRIVRRRVVKVVKKIVKRKLMKRGGGDGLVEGLSAGSGKDGLVVGGSSGSGGLGSDEKGESRCGDDEGKKGSRVGVEDGGVGSGAEKGEMLGVVEEDGKGEVSEREEIGKLGGDGFDDGNGRTGNGKLGIEIEGKGSEVELKGVMNCHGEDKSKVNVGEEVEKLGEDGRQGDDKFGGQGEGKGIEAEVKGDMDCHEVDNGCADGEGVMEGVDIGLGRDHESEGVLKIEGEKGNPRVVFSGEMEALERKKRRKTEIFIGGLDKDAVEEDIRKVFKEVGEIVEVTLLKNESTGKNKGYAFVRFASADDASRAVKKYSKVEICGKESKVAAVQGNDTLHLGNIDKKWKSEDVTKLLHQIGIDKIDKVTVLPDPNNSERNRGFAFLELQTCKDAQIAYKALQKKDVIGKLKNIRVAWAEPLNEPNEEEMQKVKSVYVEYIPSYWDEGKLKAQFERFGEIESVALAKSLQSSRRKDIAFVNYTRRDAAIACINSSNHEALSDQGSKVNLKVSLARPIDHKKPKRGASNPVIKAAFKEKPKAAQGVPSAGTKDKSVSTRNIHGYSKSSTNTELVHLLREQASWGQTPGRLSTGYLTSEYHLSISGKKRPFAAVAEDPIYSDPRVHSQMYLDNSIPGASSRPLLHGPSRTSFPYHLLQGANSMSGVAYAGRAETSGLKREDLYGGKAGQHYRYK